MNWFHVFGGNFFTHPSFYILSKHNIKETSSKRNIWGPLYILKGEESGGDQIRWKKSWNKKDIYIHPNQDILYGNG